MTYSLFKGLFRGVSFKIEDLFLLESFQIAYLPGYLPDKEFAAVLWAYPPIKTFIVKKNPDIVGYIDHIMAENGPVSDQQALSNYCDIVTWTIADLLVYNKCPEAYDRLDFHDWDFAEITSITSLDGKIVLDVGAGTGRVTMEAALTAGQVYSVEPVARLRKFIRDKAAEKGLTNVHVVDGFLHAIPFPDGFADVLLTSHALGWDLENELKEFERVTRQGGWIIHCPGTEENSQKNEYGHSRLISDDWNYQFSRYRESDGMKRKYWKRNIRHD
ncbi:MAG: class I SAM-dependent methyltransferase [Dehalococcoidales bacterium]|nr:class I SAM-dependent methyltransferase [Dehalococcoidales bacterium]